jgi:hypothetical protein
MFDLERIPVKVEHSLYGKRSGPSLRVGDRANRKGGMSWRRLTSPLLHRRSDMPRPTITCSSWLRQEPLTTKSCPLHAPLEVDRAFYDFSAEHWKHSPTTSPFERTFATVPQRTVLSKGCLSNLTALGSPFRLSA